MFLNGFRNYFGFSQKESNGILLLLLLLLALWLVPALLPRDTKEVSAKAFDAQLADFERNLVADKVYSYREGKSVEKNRVKPVYAAFDPNGLAPSAWKKMGLSEKQIAVIKRYEAKGGRFYRKEDVQKMYIISPQLYAQLAPYIRIREPKGAEQFAKTTYQKILPIVLELNAADSAALDQLKGIGPSFAARIIKYRKRLGGFYSIHQLKEVFGVDSVLFSTLLPQLSLNPALVQKMNINTVQLEQLKGHPYLSYKQINALLAYRKQHGKYNQVNDLKNIPLFTDEILRKIAPYFTP